MSNWDWSDEGDFESFSNELSKTEDEIGLQMLKWALCQNFDFLFQILQWVEEQTE